VTGPSNGGGRSGPQHPGWTWISPLNQAIGLLAAPADGDSWSP